MVDTWQDRRVLVTGARGFLGSHAVERLTALGAAVFGWVRSAHADVPRGFSVGDLNDIGAVRRVVREARPDVVLHLAGRTTAAADRELVLPTFRDNLASTVNLLSEIAELGCRRIVTTASLEQPDYGFVDGLSPYGVSKLAESFYARMFHALFRAPVAIVRPFMTYGPRQHATKVVPYVTTTLLAGRSPTITQPARRVDWIYIDDVVDGILAAAAAGSHVEGRILDLGSGVLTPLGEVVAILEHIIGGPSVSMASAAAAVGVDGRTADLAATQRVLDWRPTVTLPDGLRRTVEWCRSEAQRPARPGLDRA